MTSGSRAALGGCLLMGLVSLAVTGCVPTGDGAVGAACSEKEECASGLCFLEEQYSESTGWRDGYCSASCDFESCDFGAACLDLGGGAYCMAGCESAADCREGYRCQPFAGVCLPDCREGWDCGEGYECGLDGFCTLPGLVPTEPPVEDRDGGVLPDLGPDAGVDSDPDVGTVAPPLRSVGAPCEQSAQCASGLCLPPRPEASGGTSWIDGYCSADCSAAPCPPQSGCLRLLEGELCVAPCGAGGACRDGYVCAGLPPVCVPDCRRGYPCPGARVCNNRGLCSGGGGGGGGGAGAG